MKLNITLKDPKYLNIGCWCNSYDNAKRRCQDFRDSRYSSYGGRGIKFKITRQEVKYLYLRDEAYLMKSPTIDRIDNDGNYEFDNCRFIERAENSRRRHTGKVTPLEVRRKIGDGNKGKKKPWLSERNKILNKTFKRGKDTKKRGFYPRPNRKKCIDENGT